MRLYSGALDAQALKADDEIKLTREDVALWYDFSQIKYTTNVVVWIVLAGGCAVALIGVLIAAKKASRSTT